MDRMTAIFNETFAHLGIALPAQAAARRERGKIAERGWAIWYPFGEDEQGAYRDYYASHRMTNDPHERIRADGRLEALPTIAEMRDCSKDPVEDARLEAAFRADNREVAEMLEAKGFGIEGEEPGGVRINRALRQQAPKR
jgi:hypothetical protein